MKGEGTEVQDEEVNWSDDDIHSALVASTDPLYVGDGTWLNEAQGWLTNSASCTISEYSKYF